MSEQPNIMKELLFIVYNNEPIILSQVIEQTKKKLEGQADWKGNLRVEVLSTYFQAKENGYLQVSARELRRGEKEGDNVTASLNQRGLKYLQEEKAI